MNLVTVAIGEQYEIEARRLIRSLKEDVTVITSKDVNRISEDDLINGLYHKTNFINYIEPAEGPIFFIDADAFTLKKDPFKTFKVRKSTELAYVPYEGVWHLPDSIRQEAFNYHGHKINSGFMYFKDYKTAKKICDQWVYEYLEREKLYDTSKGTSKYEYDEWALMIALKKLNIKTEQLTSKWNDWKKGTEEDLKSRDSIFIQSHDYLDII